MRVVLGVLAAGAAALLLGSCDQFADLGGCKDLVLSGARPIAKNRAERFLAKVQSATAQCRGGNVAVGGRTVPWVDWSNYYATGDAGSKSFWPTKNIRGINGSLIDLEYERIELIKFNLFDNSGTFEEYVMGRSGTDGPAIKSWSAMRLPPSHPSFTAVGGSGPQRCTGELIRARTLSGICNDTQNPLMGSTGTLFARNVEFESTFPDASDADEMARNRHGGRISLLVPDPQVVSRVLFTRPQRDSSACNDGFGQPGFAKTAHCDYKKAPFFNVLAAFWIQFMTHDWFSHLDEGHNATAYMPVGCASHKVNDVETPLSPDEAAQLGCRPQDAMERGYVADSTAAPRFAAGKNQLMSRAPRTFRNTNTAWWDASQIYGYDNRSRQRLKRDPRDPARLQLTPAPSATTDGEKQGYLPVLAASDPQSPEWAGQEAIGFPDNWTIGTSFYSNVFAREHNQFVDAFRVRAGRTPEEDSGLRDPAHPDKIIRYKNVTADELFDCARLVVSAEIAKIHTIEWTTQLLYNEPLYRGMNANWSGLLSRDDAVSDALAKVVNMFGSSKSAQTANQWYSVLASGPGIFGLGSRKVGWSLSNPDDINGGTNHFGSPFNFPEEFVTVYRLHPLLPDLLDYRDASAPNAIKEEVPIIETFRGRATRVMHDRGLANWALTMGRQRLGVLALQNSPRFLQNITIDRLNSPTKKIDVNALDLIRDREHGVPRFNEFRRQYGLRQLSSFDDFIDRHAAEGSDDRAEQARLVSQLREVYGQHKCDASKVITRAQVNDDGSPINDCLGHPNGSMVDNIEDLDTVVGWLAETTRPHGFAISETQFAVFILNASRRLFSDRFFTSSFRPEFYTSMGVNWVNDNGPEPMLETLPVNGHTNLPISPLKRVLMRVVPELAPELSHVVNAFDPWARDRGDYYSLAWKPRKGAESDEAFGNEPPPRPKQVAGAKH